MDICTMPEAELKKLKDSIPSFWSGKRTPEQALLERQISWIEMIDSCYCYGMLHKLPEYMHDRTIYADLPIDMMQQMKDEHIDYLRKHAVIHKAVGQDFEGVVYNSMTY